MIFLKKGFSVIEIIIVVSVLAIISFVVFPSFSRMQKAQLVRGEVENLSLFISKTRAESIASLNSSLYGIKIFEDRVVSFIGEEYQEENIKNEIILNSKISINEISLSSEGDEIIFDRLFGDASSFGSFTVSFSGGEPEKTIFIQQDGTVFVE